MKNKVRLFYFELSAPLKFKPLDADQAIEAKSGEVVSDAIDAGLKIAAETKDVNVPEVVVPEVLVPEVTVPEVS